MAAFDKLFFISQAGPIHITGEKARARSTAMEIAQFKTGGFFKLAGNYDDQFVKRDGEWLFLRREYCPTAQDF